MTRAKPKIIEGAHLGAGLGYRFLGHVERCGVILHLLDGSGEDVEGAYETIRHELAEYGGGLTEKPEVIALNKCDLLSDAEIEDKVAALKKRSHAEIFTISGATHRGVPGLLSCLLKHVLADRIHKQGVEKGEGYDPLNS